MPLFEVVVLRKAIPLKPAQEASPLDHEKEKVVFGPKFDIAKDQQSAAMQTVMEHSEPIKAEVSFERMEVLVRPFA